MKNWRLNTLKIFFTLLFLSVAARLFYWQVINYNELSVEASEQHLTTVTIESPRGRIYAADGSLLVSNKPAYLLFALIPEIKKTLGKDQKYEDKVESIVESLTPILYAEEIAAVKDPDKLSRKEKETIEANLKNRLMSQLSRTELIWVPLAKRVSLEASEKIEKLNLKGLGFEEQSVRFYPEGGLASSVLGFVGKNDEGNDEGYLGVEGFYQDQLKGRSGKLTQEVDAEGRPIIAVDNAESRPKQGLDLQLTIDRTVQYTVEKYLFEGAKKYGAKIASAIVIDPKTGEVLAIANYPSFDPDKWSSYSAEERRNSSISDAYEPGSTFKALTAASALDAGVVETDTICPCDGPIKVAGYEVQTWNNKYNPNSTMAQILQRSDNVGAAFWGKLLGKQKFISYIKNFGIGSALGIDLQGEETGLIKQLKDWGDIDLITTSFGQGISTTALQMTASVGAIANDGILMKPHVLKKISGREKELVTKPRELKRVVKSEVAQTMKELLLSAVEQGEARKIVPKGMRVGGKTGTAQIPLNGTYNPGKTVASFVGFGPIEDPRFVMLVKYVEPVPIYGAETAEPTFFKIAKELYTYWGIPIP
jgi:cell division protein FtsI/penicillin-binding protein 2